MNTSLMSQTICRRVVSRIEELLEENLQAYFELTGSPGMPPMSSLANRLERVDWAGVSSFSIDGVKVLRTSLEGGDVRVLYSLLSGGDLGEA